MAARVQGRLGLPSDLRELARLRADLGANLDLDPGAPLLTDDVAPADALTEITRRNRARD